MTHKYVADLFSGKGGVAKAFILVFVQESGNLMPVRFLTWCVCRCDKS